VDGRRRKKKGKRVLQNSVMYLPVIAKLGVVILRIIVATCGNLIESMMSTQSFGVWLKIGSI
jgi:hypothetical protein